MEVSIEVAAQNDFYIWSISIFKTLQLDDENRNLDMKLVLEEVCLNVVVKKSKNKVTNLDDVGEIPSVSASSSSLLRLR
jgi:hypothetical protein